MASHHDDHDDDDNTSSQTEDDASASPGFWLSVWENNKGAFLILISEFFGSGMDAMARFLQQSGRAVPVLQVGSWLSILLGQVGVSGHLTLILPFA